MVAPEVVVVIDTFCAAVYAPGTGLKVGVETEGTDEVWLINR
jgi:hypothetical protein